VVISAALAPATTADLSRHRCMAHLSTYAEYMHSMHQPAVPTRDRHGSSCASDAVLTLLCTSAGSPLSVLMPNVTRTRGRAGRGAAAGAGLPLATPSAAAAGGEVGGKQYASLYVQLLMHAVSHIVLQQHEQMHCKCLQLYTCMFGGCIHVM
jgi:hypothetical protein